MELKDFTVGKQGYLIRITDEQVADILPFTVGPCLSQKEREIQRIIRISEDLAWCAGHDARLTRAHPALQRVIAHHRHDAEGRYCLGCDAGAYAEDSPEWPCSTIDLILEELDG